MRQMVFRHELKFMLHENQAQILKQRLKYIIPKDRHIAQEGIYKVRSLYFEDYFNQGYETKTMGVSERYKYRIRIYNDKESPIRLERKQRKDRYVSKETALLCKNEFYQILEGRYDFLEKNPQTLCPQFYVACRTRKLRPKIVIDYEREPYVYGGGQVRLSFDRNIRASVMGHDIFDARLPMVGILKPEELILEVKFTEFLPDVIERILPIQSSTRSAFSKYTLCIDGLRQLKTVSLLPY